MNVSNRSALYAWGGPGTIRLLNTKYFSPHINEESFLSVYESGYLKKAKETVGVTDMFVTYSWGFSERTEKGDREFITKRLPHFRKNHIKTYAYVQGLNLVRKEFSDKLFCRNPRGRVIPYSKGRAFTCPNNPKAREIMRGRVEKACKEDFDGVYVDNVLFGIPPIYIYKDATSFFGCSCAWCQKAFSTQFGYALPLGKKKGEKVIADYLLFRKTAMKDCIQELSLLVHSYHKVFGINLYDPWWHEPIYYMGFTFADIEPYLDYYVVENHALSKHSIDNRHLADIAKKDKPLFVVSYRKGIGRDAAYTQKDFDMMYSDSQNIGYIPCYKATEFKTKKVWHALDLKGIIAPKRIPLNQKVKPLKTMKYRSTPFYMKWYITLINLGYSYLLPRMFESRTVSKVLLESPLYTQTVRKRRIFNP